MRVHAVSDVHIDYPVNKEWLLGLSAMDFRKDALILAGDLTDNLNLLEECLLSLTRKFHSVSFVPGNHELWVSRDKISSSMEKFSRIIELCQHCGVHTDTFITDELAIVPLFSWYDFSFGEPEAKLMDVWNDFRYCVWPEGFQPVDVTKYFLDMNTNRLNIKCKTIISFSHFLPTRSLMPFYIRSSYRYLYPVLGSEALGAQIKLLKPQIHVYGHSHVNREVRLDNVLYINNAYGYPSESYISAKKLRCIFECSA